MTTVKKPRQGSVVSDGFTDDRYFFETTSAVPASLAARRAARKRATTPDEGNGLKVRLSRLPGQTRTPLLKTAFCFQCSPLNAFGIDVAFAHNDYESLAGERSRRGTARLDRISFDSLFVDYDPTWAAYHYGTDNDAPPVDVFGWSRTLTEIVKSGDAVLLTVGQVLMWGQWDIRQLPVTVRSAHLEERADEIDTRYFTLELVEFKGADVSGRDESLPLIVTMHENGSATYPAATGEPVVLAGPLTLGRLAKRFYTGYNDWRLIAQAPTNRSLKLYGANQPLGRFARLHGTGKRGHKTVKITLPQLPVDRLPILGDGR